MATAIGIDLGTTNSAIARLDETGRSAMITNAEGDLITPSVVLFDDAEVIVGKDARSAAAVRTDRVAEWVKRDMGSPVYSRLIRGQELPPEVIQACILRKLRGDATAEAGADAEVVITVPAYFDEPRRKATADAGELAGLNVLDIVNEPTAAALAFGETAGYLTPTGDPLKEMSVLVYDLGGGTFDVTLVRLAPGDIRTLATDGDVQLGGHDWDLRLADHAAEQFQQAHGVDPREDPLSNSRLIAAATEAKHTLSARSKAVVRIDHGGQTLEVHVTREQFEDLTVDLVERTAYTTRQVLASTGLQWSDVSRALLVGGSTRMPMITRMLEDLSGLAPDRTVNPDEAVARGAAIYAGYLLAARDGDPADAAFRVTNVNAHSLGIEGIDRQTLRKTNVKVIPRNTPLPAMAKEKFITKTDGQRSIVVRVLEGESSLPDDCTAIGRTVIRDLPPDLPKGWPIEVTFRYGSNGRLNVRAVVPGTHREVTLELERVSGLSGQGLAEWKKLFSSADLAQLGSALSDAADGTQAAKPSPAKPSPGMTSGAEQPAAQRPVS
ncbi:MAG: Hsp70 family protein, partial [Planctomycetes bacterium]|nr:Hsp70 family protein [Planctomycetota bacterium]